MTKEQFKNNFVGKNIYYATEKDREKLLESAHSFGYTWANGDSLKDINNVEKNPCYRFYEDLDTTWKTLDRASRAGEDVYIFSSNGKEFKLEKMNKPKPYTSTKEDTETKPSLKDIILNKLGVEVNEEFKIDLEDSPTYRISKNLIVDYLDLLEDYSGHRFWVTSPINLQDLILKNVKIIKIPNDHLLTPKEKETLKLWDFDKLEKVYEDKEVGEVINFYKDGELVDDLYIYVFKHKFEGLEIGKHYTREELGL